MYYEARTHIIVQTENAVDAAIKIKSGQVEPYHVTKWTSMDGKFFMYAVPDGHIDNILLELAILRQEIGLPNATLSQVESITNGWIDSPEKLGRYLRDAETSEIIMKTYAQLIIGKPYGHERARFICGCCGADFLGNVKFQQQFDLDAGFGICDSCQ
jgi:hypothetical protein